MTYSAIKTQQGWGVCASGKIHGTNWPYTVIVSDGHSKEEAEYIARLFINPE